MPGIEPQRQSDQRETIASLQDVSKIFETEFVETHALCEVSLDVMRGEFVAIQGPSGCGKSTLLSVLGLLEVPSAGTHTLLTRMTQGLSRRHRAKLRNQHLGFVFQSFNLIPDLSVEENVALPLLYRGVATGQRRQRASDALDRVGLASRRDHLPAQLSGGQQQRVAVARAIVGEPDLLLADEPTGNLDSEHGTEVMELLRALHLSGATICLVTHDRRYTAYAERIIQMKDGMITGGVPSPTISEQPSCD